MKTGGIRSCRRLYAWIPLLIFLAAWQLYGNSSEERSFFFATPALVIRSLYQGLTEGTLFRHTAITAGEALVGFVAGNLVGTFVGLGLWYSETAARISRPYLAALASFPVFAIAPMTILWFGVDFWAKAVLAFWATVFLAMAQAYRGAAEVDPQLVTRFKIMGANRWTMFRYLLVPASISWTLGSLHLTIGSALLGAFIGEFISSREGLGYVIIRAGGLYDTPRVLSGVIAMILLALGMEAAVNLIERRRLADPSVPMIGETPAKSSLQ